MLRDDRQAALDNVIVASREAADLYREAAGLAEAPALRRCLEQLGGRRREMAEACAGELRRLHDLDSRPDADWETVEEVLTRLKAFWHGERDKVLVQDRLQAEERLGELLATALRHEWPESTSDLLHRFQQENRGARESLAAFLPEEGNRS